MDEKLLEDIGLNRSEIKVYIALLKLGPSSAGKIVKESGTANSKVYEVLDKLSGKGLVTGFNKSKVRYYAASSPKMIKDFLEEKKQHIDQQSHQFDKILPSLLALEKLTHSSEQASIYSGVRGYKTVFKTIVDELNKGDEIHIMGVYNFKKSHMPLALHFQKMRSEKGIKAKFLINSDAKNVAKEYSRYKPVEIRFMQEKVFTPAIFLVYKDTVIINLAEEMTYFVIRSKNTAKAFESYFQILWRS